MTLTGYNEVLELVLDEVELEVLELVVVVSSGFQYQIFILAPSK